MSVSLGHMESSNHSKVQCATGVDNLRIKTSYVEILGPMRQLAGEVKTGCLAFVRIDRLG